MASEFYLERVGFEFNVKLRLDLKIGINVIGRINTKGIDIAISSDCCSAHHCIITVSNNSVEIENRSKRVGTTVNDVKMGNEIIELKEHDVIGIVRGAPCNLVGNYNYFVYRLRKYSSENLPTIEIDDDMTYEISDDDNLDDDIIILDPIDATVDNDLGMQLSRNFNLEIKQEIQDLDEFETFCKDVKQEPSNFFDVETIDDPNQCDEFATFDPHSQRSDVLQESFRSEINDSDDIVVFSPTRDQGANDNAESESEVGSEVSNTIVSSDNTCSDVTINDETETKITAEDRPHVPKKLERTIKESKPSKKTESEKTIVTTEDRPHVQNKLEKSSRKNWKKNEESCSSKPKNDKVPDHVNDKLKSSSKPEKSVKVKESITTAKVKYTKDNRGAFLTDPTQIPGLPAPPKKRQQSTNAIPLLRFKQNEIIDKDVDNMLSNLEIPNDVPPLPQITDPTYSNYKVKKLKFADLQKTRTAETDNLASKPSSRNGTHVSAQLVVENIMERLFQNETFNLMDDQQNHRMPVKQSGFVQNETFNLLDDQQNHKMPVKQSGFVQNETFNLLDDQQNHKMPVKQSEFQINPCHEIISKLTSYDSENFQTLEAFCRSGDSNLNAFRDEFKDYKEYRETILPLIMSELWKEIEIEYNNSKTLDFTTLTVTDTSREKRGDGHRLVFHCQVSLTDRCLFENHIVLARGDFAQKQTEFLAIITTKTADHELAHYTLETSISLEAQSIKSLQIRPITVITNTMNGISSVHYLRQSPLLNLVLNPLSGELPAQCDNVIYKGYDKLDTEQMPILKAIYKRCINLKVPNIALLDGAAGTGKSCMIVNLALQLVYGDNLPRPLRILICSRSNRNVDEIAKKLIHVRNKTSSAQKIQLVRFGVLEQIENSVRCISVQHMKANERRFLQLANLNQLKLEKRTLELKIRALTLDDENDNAAELKLWKSKLVKVDTLTNRLRGIEKSKLNNATTVLLNACDIICTTLGSITTLQNYINCVDVCIIDEATQCNESITLLPFRFGMPSLVLVGDSRLEPPMVYSSLAQEKNYGNSLFSRFRKLFLGKSGPLFRINMQHRMHPEILQWPNQHFYNNCLLPDVSKIVDYFPIVPYKCISYNPVAVECENVMSIINVLLGHIDWRRYSFGIICTNTKQRSILQNKLRDRPFIASFSAEESHIFEKDIILIWISKENGMSHLCDRMILNRAITRARRCLLICGADLMSYKSRWFYKSLLDNAEERNCFHHMKSVSEPKLENLLRKKVF